MPLTFDMSLAELETYQGRNPRPDNFRFFLGGRACRDAGG